MNVEPVMLPIVRGIRRHPRLSNQLFRFAKWGDPFAPERFSSIYDKMNAKGPASAAAPINSGSCPGTTRWSQSCGPPTPRAVSSAFTPRRVGGYELRVRSLADELLSGIADESAPDIIPALTARLPVYAIAELVSDESALSDDEVISKITVLMFAGHETTTSLLGNSIVALASGPHRLVGHREVTAVSSTSASSAFGAAGVTKELAGDFADLNLV
jgi:hypothetical protein